ncbi:hypothetical protein FEM48_Zijuj07G0171500 [Ziziphus jujuba var. spinosa]|uniref:Leucine-rich repeat-containing N-terminal plant-type domain-containing protein n=1 Tax=Ziziphus jujuba var. spinosa TaxID=714518 RepID=A0A978V5W6_ZIZJJ|nr:hypothetical protein FEM48_Zijuj07G0171500 [Ziziphus jujuba var. spinosa]
MFLFNVTALHLSRNKFSNLNCLCDIKGRAVRDDKIEFVWKGLLSVPGTPSTTEAEEDYNDEFISQGFYLSMGVGYVVGFWGVFGTLLFTKSWRRRALLKLKDNLESYNNDTLSSWDHEEEKKDCCSWEGVGCDNITGHVIMLDLSHLQLYTTGRSLNPPLIELRYLIYLDLSGINFWGNNISSLIGNNMVSLQRLDLSSTELGSSIPETIGNNMTSLSYLDLSFAKFSMEHDSPYTPRSLP